MRVERFIVFVMAMVMMSCHHVPEVEVRARECASMPVPRASAVSCSLSGKGYVFSGRAQNGAYLKDLWEYDAATDQWKQVSSFPGKARVSAAMIAYDGALYMGLGYGKGKIYADSSYLHDWWRWDPNTDQWTELASYPQETTVSPTLFAVGSRIYAIYGTSGCFTREINYYDTKTNRWHSTPDSRYRALSAFGSVGAVYDGRCFYGLGNNTNNLKQWYTVDLEADDWTRLHSAPGKGRTFSACAASKDAIYVFGGRCFAGEMTGGEVFPDILQYSPKEDEWRLAGEMPCGRAENQIAFAINGKVYFGLGEDENGTMINQLYCLEE